MAKLPSLRFIEPYDPTDETLAATTQPYCFVADLVEKSEAYIDVTTMMNKGVKAAQWDALADLRDHVAPGETIGWFAIHNGDEERVKNAREGREEADGSISEVCGFQLTSFSQQKPDSSAKSQSTKKLSGKLKNLMKK